MGIEMETFQFEVVGEEILFSDIGAKLFWENGDVIAKADNEKSLNEAKRRGKELVAEFNLMRKKNG